METDTQRARVRWPLAERSSELELLDLGRVTGDELRTNLADLARLNRLPGGIRASLAGIERLAAGRASLTVLDVGTGSADVPMALATRGWAVVAVESDPAVASIARERAGTTGSVRVVDGDARSLPLDDGSVDVAHGSLLLHHLDPAGAVTALREMARVARLGVVVNDLRRGLLPLIATGATLAVLGRCRTTRHDGILSVRRSYTIAELDELLNDAGLRVVHRSWRVMPRVVTVAVQDGAR